MKLTKMIRLCVLIALTPIAHFNVFSADALDAWTTSSSATQDPVHGIGNGNGQFVGVGGKFDDNGNIIAGTIITSRDSFTWAPQTSGVTNAPLNAVAYGNGQFVAVGGILFRPNTKATILTSADGKTWLPRDAGPTNVVLYAVTYGNGQFVAAGTVGALKNTAVALASTDGVNWTPSYWVPDPNQTNPDAFTSITYGNGLFVALGHSDLKGRIATSADGINWTQYYDMPGQGPQHLAFGNNLFIAAGGYTDAVNTPGVGNRLVSHAVIWSSNDGVNWDVRQDYTNNVDNGFGFTFAEYGAGIFVVGGATAAPNGKWLVHSSVDGTNWTPHALPSEMSAMTFGAGRLVGLGPGGVATQSGVIGKLGASLTPPGNIRGTVTGVTGQAFVIQTSNDLSHWGILNNVTVSTNGVAQFADQISSAVQRRFYEASVATR